MIATSVTVPLVVILGLVIGHAHESKTSPTPSATGAVALPAISVSAPPADPAATAPCTSLLATLPITLDGLSGRPALSSSSFVVAWGQPAVVLRCGVQRPAVLVPGSSVLLPGIDGVFYAAVTGKKATIYTSVDRAAYIEITVPSQYSAGPMPALSDAIAAALPAVCVVDGSAAPNKQCTHRG